MLNIHLRFSTRCEFFSDDLNEIIFLKTPEGLNVTAKERVVCERTTPAKCWYSNSNVRLINIGFTRFLLDLCLYYLPN